MRRRVIGGLALLALALAVVLRAGGDDSYTVELRLTNAHGLSTGGEVRLGGVEVGHVSRLAVDDSDMVVATLVLEREARPIGAGASAAIAARNLLGQKFVDLDPGDQRRPLPSGARIPRSRITTPTDLDQVLDVLDADTRTRLQVLINEAGVAVAGRRADLGATLRLTPPSVRDLGRMLEDLDADGRTLGRLVRSSDRLVTSVARERPDLGRLVERASQAAGTVAARRAELGQTLDRAPATLRSLDGFLAELDATARPLGPAATQIRRASGPLREVLAGLGPVRRAASPALAEAVSTAPALTRLAAGLTPVLRAARPTAAALEGLTAISAPLARTLDVSIVDVLAIVHGWALAIQTRDGISHSFRAHVNLNAEVIESLIRRLGNAPPKAGAAAPARKGAGRPQGGDGAGSGGTASTPGSATPSRPAAPAPLKPLLDTLQGITGKLVPGSAGGDKAPAPAAPKGVGGLLDFLLGS